MGINPVTFQVDPREDFIDLNESFFEVELAIKTGGGGNLAQATLVGLANNLAHTLFKQINVRLSGTLISPQTDTYHYKAYIEALLNHDRDDGESIMTPEGWYNCLSVPSRGEADVMTANKLDTTHAEYEDLPQDLKNMVQSRIQFFGGKRVTLRFKPYLKCFISASYWYLACRSRSTCTSMPQLCGPSNGPVPILSD